MKFPIVWLLVAANGFTGCSVVQDIGWEAPGRPLDKDILGRWLPLGDKSLPPLELTDDTMRLGDDVRVPYRVWEGYVKFSVPAGQDKGWGSVGCETGTPTYAIFKISKMNNGMDRLSGDFYSGREGGNLMLGRYSRACASKFWYRDF